MIAVFDEALEITIVSVPVPTSRCRVRRMPFSDGTKVTGIAIGHDCGWAESYVDHK